MHKVIGKLEENQLTTTNWRWFSENVGTLAPASESAAINKDAISGMRLADDAPRAVPAAPAPPPIPTTAAAAAPPPVPTLRLAGAPNPRP